MNMVWVLFIITIYTGGDQFTRGLVSFETEETCQAAVETLRQSRPWGDWFNRMHDESVLRMKFVCQKTPNR